MTDGEILAAIGVLTREKLAWRGPVRPELRLVEDLGLDSLRRLALAVEVENCFQVRLDEGDEASIETIGELVTAVRRRLGGVP